MKLYEAIEEWKEELIKSGVRDFRVESAVECEVDEYSYLVPLFNCVPVGLDAEVEFKENVTIKGKKNGVLLDMTYIMKGKRKPIHHYKSLLRLD